MRLSMSGVINNCSVTKSFVKGQDVCVGVAVVCPSCVIYTPGYLLRLAWHALNPAWRRDALCRLAGASPRRRAEPQPQIPPPPQSFPQPQTHYIRKYSINPSPTCLKSWTWLNQWVCVCVCPYELCLFVSLSMLMHHTCTNVTVSLPGHPPAHLFTVCIIAAGSLSALWACCKQGLLCLSKCWLGCGYALMPLLLCPFTAGSCRPFGRRGPLQNRMRSQARGVTSSEGFEYKEIHHTHTILCTHTRVSTRTWW